MGLVKDIIVKLYHYSAKIFGKISFNIFLWHDIKNFGKRNISVSQLIENNDILNNENNNDMTIREYYNIILEKLQKGDYKIGVNKKFPAPDKSEIKTNELPLHALNYILFEYLKDKIGRASCRERL